ncbi:MAG: LPS export ABC transporter periplasmic protein LptC [Candidatus Omnitrophica bacterium]|nr:LPS export ABC transporter periplasmic protein LptC [Candidatus Omnitrophota bacterium]
MVRIFVLCLALVVFQSAAAFGLAADSKIASTSEPQQMEDFNIAGYDGKGEKTWEVEGASMDMAGNDVKISDITAHLYGNEKNKENMVLTADRGQFDRATGKVRLEDNVRAVTDTGAELTTSALDWSQKDQVISSDEKVNISRDNVTAVGEGLEAKSDMKVAKLEKDVVVTMQGKSPASSAAAEGSSEGSPEGAADSQATGPGKMTITCDGPMELDYEHQIATFEKNVQVTGDADQGSMVSDKMTIYFNNQTKQMDRIVAEGHVKIMRDENTSYSDSAVFTAADRKVVLTGRPHLEIFPEEGSGLPNVSP